MGGRCGESCAWWESMVGQEGCGHDGGEEGPRHTRRWQVLLEERQLAEVQNKQFGLGLKTR